jgi:predicted ATPase
MIIVARATSLASRRSTCCGVRLYYSGTNLRLEVIDQGLLTASHNSERIFEAELYRLKARVVLARRAPNAQTDAQSLIYQALKTARHQNTRSLEFRAARDLAELWIAQGRRVEAFDLLAPIHASFTEGFDTQDLREGTALLDQRR